jgi:hypothetical protein
MVRLTTMTDATSSTLSVPTGGTGLRPPMTCNEELPGCKKQSKKSAPEHLPWLNIPVLVQAIIQTDVAQRRILRGQRKRRQNTSWSAKAQTEYFVANGRPFQDGFWTVQLTPVRVCSRFVVECASFSQRSYPARHLEH